jgi:hypothetical protein
MPRDRWSRGFAATVEQSETTSNLRAPKCCAASEVADSGEVARESAMMSPTIPI